PQDRMRDRQGMAWHPAIHQGIVQDQVFHMHEFTLKPHRSNRIVHMHALNHTFTYGRTRKPLVEPHQSCRSPADGDENFFERQIVDLIGHIPHIAAECGKRQTKLLPYPRTSATLTVRPSLIERRAASARAKACSPSSAEGGGACPVSSASIIGAISA